MISMLHCTNQQQQPVVLTKLSSTSQVTGAASPATAADATEHIFYARRLLYVSHFFAQWSKTSWQFCLALFLAAVTHFESLILVSWYGMVVGLAVAVTGGRVGQWIDTSPNCRLTVARWLIGGIVPSSSPPSFLRALICV